MKNIIGLIFFFFSITILNAQDTPVNHYFNVNISTGKDLINRGNHNWISHLQLDYDIIKRLGIGIHYDFGKYDVDPYSSFTAPEQQGSKIQYIGTTLQYTFVSFKNSAFNADKHYGIYLKGYLDKVHTKIVNPLWDYTPREDNFWSKELNLGMNFHLIKHFGIMGECNFVKFYKGDISFSHPTWRAGITYQFYKLK